MLLITLNKTITQRFFNTDKGYDELIKFWSNLIQSGYKPSVYELFLYAVLRGKDYRKGLTPVTNSIKLANGQDPYLSRKRAIYWLHHRAEKGTIFDSLLSSEALTLIKSLIPRSSIYNLSDSNFCYEVENATV